jgi:hypothetical protein
VEGLKGLGGRLKGDPTKANNNQQPITKNMHLTSGVRPKKKPTPIDSKLIKKLLVV